VTPPAAAITSFNMRTPRAGYSPQSYLARHRNSLSRIFRDKDRGARMKRPQMSAST